MQRVRVIYVCGKLSSDILLIHESSDVMWYVPRVSSILCSVPLNRMVAIVMFNSGIGFSGDKEASSRGTLSHIC